MEYFNGLLDANGPTFDLVDKDKEFIGEVWDTYKNYSAGKLREMTHLEEPWMNARKGYGPGDQCQVEITKEALASYFTKLAS